MNNIRKIALSAQKALEIVSADENVLNLVDPAFSENTNIISTNMFNYRFIPETDQGLSVYLGFDTNIDRVETTDIININLNCHLFVKKENMTVDAESASRLDELAFAIIEALDGIRIYGAGVLCLESIQTADDINGYCSKIIVFSDKIRL